MKNKKILSHFASIRSFRGFWRVVQDMVTVKCLFILMYLEEISYSSSYSMKMLDLFHNYSFSL